MLFELCKELNNFFETAKLFDTFTIENGTLNTDFLQEGQYFRIVGSVFNDGVYRYPADLKDETFDGAIWAMAVPEAVIALADEIQAWKDQYMQIDSPAMSPYQSESFGGYSYSKASTIAESSQSVSPWEKVYADRLKLWRKLR